MELEQEIARVAAAASAFADEGEALAGIVAAEPRSGARLYLCAYESRGETRSWLGLDAAGGPVLDRDLLREAVSIAALCELAEESAAGGDPADLRARLAELHAADVELGAAEDAARALEQAIEVPPRIARPEYLDRIAAAARKLEQALGSGSESPFALALQQGMTAVEALVEDVQRSYKRPLA